MTFDFPLGNDPIYNGARITAAQSALLIMMLYIQHGLTQETLTDIFLVIEIQCLAPNMMWTSYYHFKKVFTKLYDKVKYHYMCAACNFYIGEKSQVPDMCPVCSKNLKEKGALHSFVSLPIAEQIHDLFLSKCYILL